jgi:hypothetical protein
MPYFDAIPKVLPRIHLEACAPLDTGVVLPRQCGRLHAGSGQEVEKLLQQLAAIAKARRKLPEYRAQLVFQLEQPGCEEVRERRLDAPELEHVGDIARALEGEDEVVGNLVAPSRVARRRLERIEAAVELDAVETLGGIRELQALGQVLGIELAAPAGVTPAGDADARGHGVAGPRHLGLRCVRCPRAEPARFVPPGVRSG